MKETLKSIGLITAVLLGPYVVVGGISEIAFRLGHERISKNIYRTQGNALEFYHMNSIGVDTNADGKIDYQLTRTLPSRVTPSLLIRSSDPSNRFWNPTLQDKYYTEYQNLENTSLNK